MTQQEVTDLRFNSENGHSEAKMSRSDGTGLLQVFPLLPLTSGVSPSMELFSEMRGRNLIGQTVIDFFPDLPVSPAVSIDQFKDRFHRFTAGVFRGVDLAQLGLVVAGGAVLRCVHHDPLVSYRLRLGNDCLLCSGCGLGRLSSHGR
jgi:hypothetical protein